MATAYDLLIAASDYDELQEYIEDPHGEMPPVDIPPFKPDFSNIIVIDNVPIVKNLEKAEKLKKLLFKIYSAVCEDLNPEELDLLFDSASGTTPGFAFLKFPTKEDAEEAVKVTNNHPLDKNHTLKVCLYSDLDVINAVSDEYVPPQEIPFRATPDVVDWLTDPLCRDQFVVRYNHETEVHWANTAIGDLPDTVYAGDREKHSGRSWCESYVQWSPQGTYLATFHPQGIKLWGTNKFEPQGKFLHASVEQLDISPCESYLLTCVLSNYESSDALSVWDIRKETKIRSFPLKNPRDVGFWVQADVTVEDKTGKKYEKQIRGKVVAYDERHGFTISEGLNEYKGIRQEKVVALQDPNKLKWSHDGKYLARLGPGIIQVYELPSMNLLDKKSLAAKDILDFAWSPKGNMISYWSPASGNLPALVSIVSIPDRNVLASRKLFDVQEVKMTWQDEGDYLCVHMPKLVNKKKSTVLMVFRVRAANIPVELTEIPDSILDVQWEPSRERFAVMQGESRTPTISFYSMEVAVATTGKGKEKEKKKELTFLFSLTGKQCSELVWSPAGGVIALPYYASDTCLFELHDVDNNVNLAQRRHDRGTKVIWDPSGRILASCTFIPLRQTAVRPQPDDGFNFYTFQGTPLCQVRKEKLYQLIWRPRPKNLLSPEEKAHVLKNLKKYEKMFDKEDRAKKALAESAANEERKVLADAFLRRLKQKKDKYRHAHRSRILLRNGYDSDNDNLFQVDIQMEEIVVSTKTQIIN